MQKLTSDLLEIKPAFKFIYVTDLGYTRENIDRLLPFIESADFALIESNYRDTEIEMALAKGHLTTRQSAFLAAFSGAKTYQNTHLSSTYDGEVTEMLEEAQAFFHSFRQMSREELAAEMQKLFYQ